MDLNKLTAISPIDGRYREQVNDLIPYFSEFGLFKYRLLVEIEYFIALCEIPLLQLKGFDKKRFNSLREVYRNFSVKDAEIIKKIEQKTNHDVKAVEYFLKDKFSALKIPEYAAFIHFGLTSQDINNSAIPFALKEGLNNSLLPLVDQIAAVLNNLAKRWKDVPMLARTHGQPASPTILGKELMVFVERLNQQLELLNHLPFSAKFGGATGNFNAHHAAYPKIDWVKFADKFVKGRLGLKRNHYTTQIEHYDNLAALFDNLKRINTILIDLNRDMWQYISMEYFQQKTKESEVGSSTMPHKVNPIDFENSEGNLGLANALFEHFAAKLPVSRLQRDLTDSTVLRNIGISLAHTIVGYKSLMLGLDKIVLNETAIKTDLENNWVVVAEGIQTILRREGYPDPYEALKTITRTNEKITKEDIVNFIEKLDVDERVKKELKSLTPYNYTGVKLL